jgi:hypothetical protein
MTRIIAVACAYGAAILIAELTVGNAGFPLHLWHFERIPAWHWSLPVHAAGFLWITAWTRVLRRRPASFPAIASWAFFAAAELLNRFCLGLFDYSREPLGINLSFAAVLALYAMLCAASVYALMRWVFHPRGR